MKYIAVNGNVGKDPQIRMSQEGKEFCSFSLGISVGTKQNPKTDWVDIVVNGKLVEMCGKHVTKGTKLLITGFPSVNSYINKENQAIGTLRINANTIEFIGSKPEKSEDEVLDDNLEPCHIPF